MVKVLVDLHNGTARFTVAVKAKSVQQALNIVASRHPASDATMKFQIDPEGFFVEHSAA